VTDANVVLGFLEDGDLLGGTIRVNKGEAERVVDECIARPLGVPTLEAAHAVRTVANATMARAIRAISVERGRDVRTFALCAFGGGGPGHAAEVARLLGIGKVIIPVAPGVFSALGLGWCPLEHYVAQVARVRLAGSTTLTLKRLAELYDVVEAKATNAAISSLPEGRGRVSVRRYADVHYEGQLHELTIPVASLDDARGLERLRQAFEDEHMRTFGYNASSEIIEVRTVRATACVADDPGEQPRSPVDGVGRLYRTAVNSGRSQRIYFGPEFGQCDVPSMSRHDLGETATAGPLILPELDTTIVVPPDFTARRTATGSVVLQQRVEKEGASGPTSTVERNPGLIGVQRSSEPQTHKDDVDGDAPPPSRAFT
jgi:N-methylhydantoinase A